jgi:hypothetical protein
MVSPLTGPAGNVEFLLHGSTGGEPASPDAVEALLSGAVREATGTGPT